jgi:hypothetical protein
MKVKMTIIRAGDLAGMPVLRVDECAESEANECIEAIRNAKMTRKVVLVDETAMPGVDNIFTFIERLRTEVTPVFVVYRTGALNVHLAWTLMDHIILDNDYLQYTGTPANEVHLFCEKELMQDGFYPVVSPIGADRTHVYVYGPTEDNAMLMAWAAKAPYPMRLLYGRTTVIE